MHSTPPGKLLPPLARALVPLTPLQVTRTLHREKDGQHACDTDAPGAVSLRMNALTTLLTMLLMTHYLTRAKRLMHKGLQRGLHLLKAARVMVKEQVMVLLLCMMRALLMLMQGRRGLKLIQGRRLFPHTRSQTCQNQLTHRSMSICRRRGEAGSRDCLTQTQTNWFLAMMLTLIGLARGEVKGEVILTTPAVLTTQHPLDGCAMAMITLATNRGIVDKGVTQILYVKQIFMITY